MIFGETVKNIVIGQSFELNTKSLVEIIENNINSYLFLAFFVIVSFIFQQVSPLICATSGGWRGGPGPR